MDANHLRQYKLSNDLDAAVEAQQWLLHYQPQIDVACARIIGFEALLRWQHPLLGLIGPNEFIPIAEKNGTIAAITEWVLRAASQQCQHWQKQFGFAFSMSVNVAPQSLETPQFTETVLAILQDTSLPAHDLCLEITEHSLMTNPQSATLTLQALHEHGIKFALDDFGAGYSSFSHLKNFPIDILKVDRSFITDIETNPANSVIINSFMQLAQGLHLQAIVEGVEQLAQVESCVAQGGRYFQGYYFSEPLPADQCAAYIKNFKQ